MPDELRTPQHLTNLATLSKKTHHFGGSNSCLDLKQQLFGSQTQLFGSQTKGSIFGRIIYIYISNKETNGDPTLEEMNILSKAKKYAGC